MICLETNEIMIQVGDVARPWGTALVQRVIVRPVKISWCDTAVCQKQRYAWMYLDTPSSSLHRRLLIPCSHQQAIFNNTIAGGSCCLQCIVYW